MDKYKARKLLIFLMGAIATTMLALTFSWAWVEYYGYINEQKLFFYKGYWLLIMIYVFLIYILFRLYDGYKFGIQTRTNVVYSETVAIV
ncbi:MAG: hypothetical protein K6G26_03215, partial [Lachnospiraceae bacterium]|nr:hypothetical protein [Lachnospiraceae bacterium]